MDGTHDTYLFMLQETIKRHGYAVQYVFGDPVTDAAPYGYTVGLHESYGYELAVAGLDGNATALVLHRLSEQLRGNDEPPTPDLQIREVIRGYPLKLRPVQDPDSLGIVGALYGFNPPAWQGLWPDAAGHFPGDEGYAVTAAGQRLL